MTKFIKTLLSIAGGCLVLGIILSIVGLCLGGRLTSIRVGWDNGPRVYYTDAFTDGEFGMFRADASGAPSGPWCALPLQLRLRPHRQRAGTGNRYLHGRGRHSAG